MENASKALLIAGAILIAILLIALGMMAYTAGKGQVEKSGSQLDAAQVQSANSVFTNYEGRRTGSEVKALASLVASYNANTQSVFNTNNVNIAYTAPLTAGTVNINNYYNVTVTAYRNNGLVQTITVEAAN